ncbi:alpha-amylase family glycosyl hydrolase [Butyrivibrio sp. XPD2006]|uniref:alpha-amylase family glycosyl hydrolase n=1 Tax=Butyrivibrio sp. XPD2006 TaxID=1280668 RepID=UPI0003B5E227|nr:alpha-amylase family glycosyl hydrolase [Butyrivibrio sp. XPD2006]
MSFDKKTAVSLGLTVALAVSVVTAGMIGGKIGFKSNGEQEVAQSALDSAAGEVAANELPVNVIDDKYRTTYEVFVYSFCDSDGDGIGDLKGLTSKLDYISDGDVATDTDLGCNEIWLMPVSPSPTYHKYDVTDYKDIDPEYGTLEDFDELIKACHDRGIRVIIDQVYNHSSVEHPWFKEAAEFLADHPGITFEDGNYSTSFYIDCPKLSYYNFANEKKDGYEPLPGTDYFYEARFWSGMPDLNLDSDAVRREIADITGFWLDHGVDGFRLDAVTSYYTGNDPANIEFMTWLNDTVKAKNPDAYIVAEAWTNSATYHKYYASGIDSFFDFDYAGSEGVIAGVAKGTAPASRYAEALVSTQKALETNGPGTAIDAPFYVNHDMARSAGYFTGKGAEDKLKLSWGLNLLMPGNAFIYYGEELGMKGSGKDENKRAPMYWTADTKADGMCKGPTAMDSFKMKYPAADEQSEDPASIYNYVKAAIKARNIFPAIARGETAVISELTDSDICTFTRCCKADDSGRYDAERLFVVINTSDEAKTIDLSAVTDAVEASDAPVSGADIASHGIAYQLNTGEEWSSLENATLTMAPYGIVMIRF